MRNTLGSRYGYYRYRGCLGIRTGGGLDIGMYGYRDLPPCMDTETASILVLLGFRYTYKGRCLGIRIVRIKFVR